MGAGPEQLLRAGLRDALTSDGHEVDVSVVEAPGSWRAEIATTFTLAAEVAKSAREARKQGRFPFLLTGNCMMTLRGAASADVRGLARRAW
jgi:arginase